MIVVLGLLPSLVLLVGAFLIVLPLPFASRFRPFLPLFANALAIASLLFLSSTQHDPLTLFEPSDILPTLTLTVQWSGAPLWLGIFLLLILSARFLMSMDEDTSVPGAGMLVLEGGALLFLAADNWTTVTTAWGVVEIALLIIPTAQGESRERVSRAFAWNLAAIVLWLTAGMIAANDGGSLRLVETGLQGTSALLCLLAVWIRCGLYPFQAAAPAAAESFGARVGVPILLGGYLLSRVLAQVQGAMTFAPEMQLLALVVVGLSGLLVVAQPHGADSFDWVLRAVASPLLLLPFFFNPLIAPALALWLALGAFAVCNVIGIAWLWRAQLPRVPLNALVWIFALVLTAALPLTPAFTARVDVLAASYGAGQLPLWLLFVATMALILIPLWREIIASRESAPKVPTYFEYAAFACLLLPSLAAAFLPMQFASVVGTAADAGMKFFAGAFAPSSAGAGAIVFLVAGLVVPLLASFELARRWERRSALLPMQMAGILDLSGLFRTIDFIYRFFRALLQRALAVLEQPPIAWLIFVAIWVAVWLRGLGT